MVAATVPETVPATGVFGLVWLLIALPLAGAAILLIGGRRTDRWGHWLGVLTPLAAFGLAVAMFVTMLGRPSDERSYGQHIYDWVVVGKFEVPFGLQLDQLSMLFVLLITGVGGLIHVYSVGYMSHDPDRRRFFGYLNLFVAAMLLLVLADNYLLLYFGWEGVGLASYLLIGFWFAHTPNAVAGNKAFFVNRVGDMGMSLAIMLMFVTFGSVTFQGVLPQAGQASGATLDWLGILLLVAACGKSAQFPLQSWLLDAMAGPTPVSALIHAATMVTAGVYLITRSNPIFDVAPTALTVVLVVGCITLLMGAIIACAKDDIKKSLAGSTMSQIGYMVVAAGLGPAGYVFAIFHLLLHGFFKATLFLSAGSVMHAMKNEVDMRRYGALRGALMFTFIGFTAAYLAIIGIPPFDGFYSKDKIIETAFAHGWVVGLVTLIGAGITAFYMTRMFAMTFTGQARWEDDRHPHESPPSMTVPILILAVLSTVAGFILAQNDRIEDWLEPVLGYQESHLSIPAWAMSAITLVVVLAGIGLAWLQYGRRPIPVVAPRGSVLTRAARADLYGDTVNEALLMRPGQWLTRFLVFFDNRGVDGVVGGTAATIGGLSGRARRWQNGYVRSYALTMLAGSAVLGLVFVLVRV